MMAKVWVFIANVVFMIKDFNFWVLHTCDRMIDSLGVCVYRPTYILHYIDEGRPDKLA